MTTTKNEMFDFLSSYLSKSDIYATKAIAKISMFIFQKRCDLGMTQKAFAEMMGVTQGMVSKWESAEYNFTVENIAQISEKLNVTFDIEFTPESEYLQNNTQNEYEDTVTGTQKTLASMLSVVGVAA